MADKKTIKKTSAKVKLTKATVPKQQAESFADSMKLVADEVDMKILPRRKVRNIIHRIRSNRLFDKWEIDRAAGIKLIFEPQFREVEIQLSKDKVITEKMSWKNFTFLWDIHPIFPLVSVVASEWIHSGGGYKKFGKNNNVPSRICEPTAFTQQQL